MIWKKKMDTVRLKKEDILCVYVCVCVFLSAQKNFPYSEMIFHISF